MEERASRNGVTLIAVILTRDSFAPQMSEDMYDTRMGTTNI